MPLRPMIDDLELPLVQELDLLERRDLAEHRPPGMDGSLLQNLGRGAACLALWGVAAGPDALELTEELDGIFRAGEPVSFIADIVEDSEIETVQIDDLRFQELAGRPRRVAFALTLREHVEPVEPEDVSPMEAELLEDAEGLMDDLVEGLDLGLDFVTGLERFVPRLQGLLERLQQSNQELRGGGG